jgi:hypothetical protein
MGLDMYLTGEKYLPTDFEAPEKNLSEDGFRVKGRQLELGYWRKHPNLHDFIVETFADGVDEYQEIELTKDCIQQIIHAVKGRQLPETTGFYFGESDDSDEQIADDVGIFEAALKWLETEEPNVWKSISYRASW